jgi:hypothetical protein
VYEDLRQIAQLKFNKEMEFISKQTREKVKELQNKYAVLTGSSGTRSGPHEASIGRTQIDGSERLVRALFKIWVDLIERRNGHISRQDIAHITGIIDGYARTQIGHLKKSFSERRMGAVVNLLSEEAEIKLQGTASSLRGDLEIMVREHEAFPKDNVGEERMEAHMTRRSAIVLSILIASPSDVKEEREVVTQAIYNWNASHFLETGIILNPIKWESHSYPASGNRPQAIINKQLVDSGDILVGIFGYKLGTPTGVAQSGTIEEIEEFRRAGKYIALYFSTANVPRGADRDQLEALEAYKVERKADTLYTGTLQIEFGKKTVTKLCFLRNFGWRLKTHTTVLVRGRT